MPMGMAARIASVALIGLLWSCTPQGDPAIGPAGFQDDFDRADLGKLWHNTGGNYKIQEGSLRIQGAKNKPLWLRRKLPRNVRVQFDVRSDSEVGDIKVELYGDGVSKATTDSYTATSYVFIFGGWGNTVNCMARMNEHGNDRVVGKAKKVDVGKTYRVKLERDGNRITAWVDGEQIVQMVDPEPLWGRGHDHFAFNNWESQLTFDNLSIEPL